MMAHNPKTDQPSGPNPEALGPIVAEHLVPILYALERCALTMEQDGRDEEAQYYRALAASISDAGGEASS